MTTKLLILAALATSLPLPAVPEPADAPPPAAKEAPIGADAAGEKSPAWLGVSVEATGEDLMRHLGLEQGVSLQAVVPDSPAAKAGLEVHDIITKVGDKAVGTMEDLRTAIQNHQAGEEVELAVIQKGRRAEKIVELGEAPEAPAGAGIHILPMGPNGNARQQLQLNLQNLQLQGGGQLQLGIEAGGGSIKMNDPAGSVEIKTRQDAREVIVRDRDGEIQYDGPWDTPQDKAAVPPEIRQRIEAIDRMFGGGDNQFHMEIFPPPPPADPNPDKPEK